MVVKRMLESNVLVAGGGAVETALSIYLESFATTLGSREQLAIAEFAEGLLVIPKTLAVNAAQDATELVAKLRAYHNTSQLQEDKVCNDARVGEVMIRPKIFAIRSVTDSYCTSRSSGVVFRTSGQVCVPQVRT